MAARSSAFRRGEDDDDEEEDDGSSVGSTHSAGAAVFSSTVSEGAEAGSVLTASAPDTTSSTVADAVVGSESTGTRSEQASREAAAGGAGAGSGPLAPSSFREGSDALSAALLETIRPPLAAISGRLVELQEAQQMLVTTIGVQRAELTEANSDWATAKAVLDRIPEYMAKVARLKKSMAAAEVAVVKAQKGAAALRAKAEAAEAARLQKRAATASSFANVSAQ